MDRGRLTRSRIQRKVGRNVPGDSWRTRGGMRSEEDGAVRLSDSDLWRETRLGAPTVGGVWGRVQGQRTRERVASWGRIVRRERGEGGTR